MTQTFLDTEDDMEWLFDTHLPNLSLSWKPRSAIIHGNEDCPERIDLFPRVMPKMIDVPLTGILVHDKYEFCGPLQQAEAMIIDFEERKSLMEI